MRCVETTSRVSNVDVRHALGRILGSAAFRASPRLTAFLRFIVERALAGEGARIKGYTIGVEALGRDADFDPQSDPIVRVVAGRLRRGLARYYAAEGFDDPVAIELRNGSYVPRFAWCDEWRLRTVALAPPGHDDRLSEAAVRGVIGSCQRQLRAIASEIAMLQQMLQRLCDDRTRANAGLACRPSSRLLPPRPIATDAARPADGRQIRQDGQVEQAQGAAAARPRRPRSG